MYIQREIESKLLDWIDEREIIGIIGPRQCGKTTTMKYILKEAIKDGHYGEDNVSYISFEDELVRYHFLNEPSSYLERLITNDKNTLLLWMKYRIYPMQVR